ncbi:MAG TPA: dTDP-4-dehydrorhamnose reductase [Thermoleophilaceae bacterium]
MRVLIAGAGGMLGRDVVRSAGPAAVALTRAQLDVTDAALVASTVARVRPDVVINCAAFTDVDGAESDPDAARRVNVDGARNVAAAAPRVIHVSTDYVFDGRAREPYVESDPVDPVSVYGQTKLEGERAVAAANPNHLIVRTAWLFGVHGPNFVETMLRLGRERGRARVVDDQIGCPTYTGHLAAGLLELAARERTGVQHLAGRGAVSWHGFARAIFDAAGLDVELEPCTTAEFPRPAPRPAWSVLGTEHVAAPTLPAWHEGLQAYLAERGSNE